MGEKAVKKVMLISEARGSWGYEFEANKKKEKFTIELGMNNIPEDHMKMLQEDNGFKEMMDVKKKFKYPKSSDVKKQTKSDIKADGEAKAIEDFKKDWADEKRALIEDHESKIKTLKNGYEADLQDARELKALAENRVKDLEKDNLELTGQVAKTQKDASKIEVEKGDLAKQVDGLKKELKSKAK